MKKLLIVESPAKIKTITKFLDKDFKIMSTVGHIKDLPSKKTGVSIDNGIELEYTVIEDKEKIIADICKEAAKSDIIYLAPDPDREGEIIAWHIGQEIEKTAKKNAVIHRIFFNEITKPAITKAIENPSTINIQKVNAQQARRVLDRWVGYEVSPILWKKITKGLSAGRVQSVALRLICDREEEIRAFKPEEYWSINSLFKHAQDSFQAALTHIGKKKLAIDNKKDADQAVAQIKKETFIVDSITDKTRLKNPLPPFMTSTLQQTAFNRLGFSVKKTMQIAQKLYEGIPLEDRSTPVALITYMRTDSLRLSETALTQAEKFIKHKFGASYFPGKRTLYEKAKKGKSVPQDAHEAIRPIDVARTPESVKAYLPADAAKLYELIWQRFVACQMKPAEYAQRQIVVKGGDYLFKVIGSTLIFDGFLKVYGVDEDDADEKNSLPPAIKEKDAVILETITPKQHFTQPPAKYTEASLVKEMEKEGIGRPSTYAAILNTIQARQYTTLDSKKRFTPTELGMTVTKMLVQNLPKIMDPKFTAHMEEDLDKIAQGDLERDTLLKDFYATFQEDLKKFIGQEQKKYSSEPTTITCPKCNTTQLVIRFGKAGEFLGCPGFPECTFTCNFERTEDNEIRCLEAQEPQILEENCPQCGKSLRQVKGRFGSFIACSGYPDCNYVHRKKAAFSCPDDGGEIIERKWRGGTFWGCSNYPKCKFTLFGDIEDSPCPHCKRPFLAKKVAKDGTVTVMCTNKKCTYKKVV